MPAPLAAPLLRLCGLSLGDLACLEGADALDVVAGDREGEQEGQLRQAEDPEELLPDIDEPALQERVHAFDDVAAPVRLAPRGGARCEPLAEGEIGGAHADDPLA